MVWLSWVFLVATVGGYVEHAKHPTSYSAVGSAAYVNLVNHTPDSLQIGAIARQVDHALRYVGTVAPSDSAFLKLPYADTRIMLLIAGGWMDLDIGLADTTRVEVLPIHRVNASTPSQ